MSVIVFAGPTLAPREITEVIADAQCRPPVAQGDVYRAARLGPKAIGIIDGYFSGAPSVWHKEILWALSQGIPVYGSASMGALRAAELHEFGMRGVGRIFEAYRDRRIEDDDEVAVMHGPAEMGYVPLSEPLVSIRATLENAQRRGIVPSSFAERLIALAKAQFFARRSWDTLFALARENGLPAAEVAVLATSVKDLQIDLKREDARAMLVAMREALHRPEPFRADFHFERTHFWDELAVRVMAQEERPSAGQLTARQVVEELRLKGPAAYEPVEARALLRLLANDRTRPFPDLPDTETVRRRLLAYREEHGLSTRRALDQWLADSQLSAADLERLLAEEATLERSRHNLRPLLDTAITDELRLAGEYAELAARATAKVGLDTDISLISQRVTPIELRLWFFSHRAGAAMPDNVATFAERLGFISLADFDAALLREWAYVENAAGGGGAENRFVRQGGPQSKG